MSETLCAIDPCIVKGRHLITNGPCTIKDCTGCLPGLAADGKLICSWHHRWGIRDLRQLPALDADLGKALVPVTSGVKPYVRGASRDGVGLSLDQHVFEARDWLRSKLSVLAAFVSEERGVTPPRVNTQDMVDFLIRNADWMSANRVIGTVWTRQVRNIMNEAKRYAYRTRNTAMKIGDCPLTADDGSICGGTIRHDPSDYAGQNVTCPACGTVGTVDWWQATIWGDQGNQLSDKAVARLLSSRYARIVPPSTIRAWASKGIIGSIKDGQGRTLYDLAVVRAHADTIWQPVPTGRTA